MKSENKHLALGSIIVVCCIVSVLFCSTNAKAGKWVPWKANYNVEVYINEIYAGTGEVFAESNFTSIASNPQVVGSFTLEFDNPENAVVRIHKGQLAIRPSSRRTNAYFSFFFPETKSDGTFEAFQLISQAGSFEGNWKLGTFHFLSTEAVLYTDFGDVPTDNVYTVELLGTRKP